MLSAEAAYILTETERNVTLNGSGKRANFITG